MNRLLSAAAVVATLTLPGAARAQVLTFEGLASPAIRMTALGSFYNGGAGPDYGIDFSPNALALCLDTAEQLCSNTSRGGLGDPNSQGGGFFFRDGDQAFMNRADGFINSFSFYYTAINLGGSFSVWAGLNGTGDLLATLTLPITESGSDGVNCYGAAFCPFVATGVSFEGVAHSVTFSGPANQIVFDDVAFTGASPVVVTPEPASVMLVGTGLWGLFAARRRRKTR
jgi:hypothetical protein